jgi:hypothetical protein
MTVKQWKPIHFICHHSTMEMIKYIIKKDVDLECLEENGFKPPGYVPKYSTSEIIKFNRGIKAKINLRNPPSSKYSMW